MDRHADTTFLAYERGDRFQDKPELVVAIDLDYASHIDQRNGWKEPGEGDDALTDELRKIGAAGLNAFWRVVLDGVRLGSRKNGIRQVMQRFVAIAWMLDPTMFKGQEERVGFGRLPPPFQLSRRQVAKLVGTTPAKLRQVQRRFLTAWGFRLHVRPVRRKQTSP